MYKGWNLFKDINIYLYHNNSKESFYKGKVVDKYNKKNNETIKNILKDKSYEIISMKNEGFHCSILPDTTYKNKRTTIPCLITKDTLQFEIDIDINNFFSLLNQSNLNKGIIKESVIFAKKGSNLCLLQENMEEYEEAIEDYQLRESLKKKTIKQEIGCNYYSLYDNYVYIGDIYLWYQIIPISTTHSFPHKYEVKILEEPKKVHILAPTKYVLSLLNGSKDLSSFIYNAIDYFNEEKLDTKSDINFETNIPKQSIFQIVDTLLPKTKGNIKLKNDICAKDLQLLLNASRDFYKYKFENNGWGLHINEYLYSAFNDKYPLSISNEEKKQFRESEYHQYVFI